jgi:GlpG protein
MRRIGSFPQRSAANRLAAYLVTQGIAAHSEEDDGQWVIWVREEDRLSDARDALEHFAADPDDVRYQDAERAANALLREESERRDAARQKIVHMRDKWGPGSASRRRPLTILIILLCVLLGLASGFGREANSPVMTGLKFADQRHVADGWGGESLHEKLIDLRSGELWRAFTPALLHGSIMHLVFNMVIFYQLGSLIEQRRGTWRLLLLILVIGVISNMGQALMPNSWGGTTNFLGLSGVVFGLIGYVWMKGRYQPELGMHLSQSMLINAVVLLVIGFLMARTLPLANWAHAFGFLVGYLIGLASAVFRFRTAG